jgi:hypothetical protein
VFISYARADQLFAKHLAEALQLKEVDIRADWQLVKGENYQDQLDDLILGADVVVFIISPDSLGSAPCRSELERAAGQHKRILPVVHRDPGSRKTELPEALSLPQWRTRGAASTFGFSQISPECRGARLQVASQSQQAPIVGFG